MLLWQTHTHTTNLTNLGFAMVLVFHVEAYIVLHCIANKTSMRALLVSMDGRDSIARCALSMGTADLSRAWNKARPRTEPMRRVGKNRGVGSAFFQNHGREVCACFRTGGLSNVLVLNLNQWIRFDVRFDIRYSIFSIHSTTFDSFDIRFTR